MTAPPVMLYFNDNQVIRLKNMILNGWYDTHVRLLIMTKLPNTHQTDRLVIAVQELSMARDLQTVMDIVRKAAREMTGADGATFILRDNGMCFYAEEDAISPLWKGLRFPMNACISGWAMINRKHTVIEDIYQDERIPIEAYAPTFVKSMAMVPIRTLDPIGAIGIYWAKQHRPPEEDIRLLQSLADITAVTMENIQVYAELEQRVRDRTNELELINRELEAFSYSVSHDLRAPLRAIHGFMNILHEDYISQLDQEAKRIASRVSNSVQEMSTLIDDLLKFFRMGKQELIKTKVPVQSLVEEVCRQAKEQEPERDIEFLIGPMPEVRADGALLRQVWINLVSNALKYTRNKPKTIIEIGIESDDVPSYYIRDNGVGFDMQYYSKLFGVFQRLHSQQEFEGTGIGLAIVQRIIKHQGEIRAESSPGQGATFYFNLPE
jgi:signal transduction histidine kinase